MKGFVFWVCLCLVSTLAFAAFGSIGNALLKAEEADVIVTVEVPSLDAVLTKLAPLAGQVNQDTGEWKEMLASKLFKVTDAKLVKFDGPMEVVVLNPQKFEVPLVISFTVTDKEKFLQGFGGEDMKLNPETKGKDIMEYIRTEPEFDQEAYMADLDAGKEINLDDYYKDVKKSFFLAFAGNRAIGTADKGLMETALASLKKPEAEVKRVVTGDMFGLVNVRAISAIYSDQLENMKHAFLPPSDEVEDFPFDIRGLMEMYFDMWQELVESTETFEFAASVIGQGDVNLQLGLTPKANTSLASFVSQQQPGKMKYLGVLPADSAIAMSWNLDFSGTFTDFYMSVFEKMFLSMDEAYFSKEEKDKVISIAKKSLENIGKGGAFSVAFGSDGFDLRGVYEIKSKALVTEGTQTVIDMMKKKMKAFMNEEEAKEFDIKFEEKTDTYKGYDIAKMSFSLPSQEMTDEEKEMMKKMFGDEISVLIGYSDNLALVGFGPKAIEGLKAMIDGLATPPGKSVLTSAGYKSATAGFPDDNLCVFYLSVGNMVKGIMGMMPEDEQDPNMGMMLRVVEEMRFSSYLTKKGDSLAFGTNIPVSQFVKAWAGFMMPPGGDFEEE